MDQTQLSKNDLEHNSTLPFQNRTQIINQRFVHITYSNAICHNNCLLHGGGPNTIHVFFSKSGPMM